ncbi:DUF4134 domain-containing protein [Chitinophaga eiseniae]|uniref:DUF4134 domain-containing protein n=1 Tax=Chitinophaga eiseniae TaxID=634771 RepID=A0A847SGA2_9BACT|nr:DUF4134 domain-containing protein [Chitinophaga eiseniae]NLR78035.1 DUF4134 domain-containing protein [Chitinophaga eiseniae]
MKIVTLKSGYELLCRKKYYLIWCLVNLTISVMVEAQGKEGIKAAETEVKGYFSTGVDLMYAVGAVSGLIGAVKVYQKWNSGDQDTSKVAASWFGSCVFLVVVATVLKAFFKV